MKIAIVNNLRLPTEKAHGYQIAKMAGEFTRTGASVSIVIPKRVNNIKEDFFTFYRTEKSFEVEEVPGFDFFRWRPYLGRLVFYLQGFIFARRARKYVNDKNVVIYSRNPEVIWSFSRAGYRTFFECHDWFGRSRFLSLWLLKLVSGIVVTNPFIRDSFIKFGVKSNKILLAPNGVNLTDFDLNFSQDEALAKLEISEELKEKLLTKKILLYTGSFRTMGEGKGISEIIESLEKLPTEAVFVAVGGNEKDILFYQQEANQKGVGERVYMFARQNHAQLALWQKAAEILLMPFPKRAHYEYFMTPLKMFEYLAAGRPIVASNLPSIKAVLNNEVALFCEPDNGEDLAEKIKTIFSDPILAEKISKQASLLAQEYTWEKRAQKIINFIGHV